LTSTPGDTNAIFNLLLDSVFAIVFIKMSRNLPDNKLKKGIEKVR
jgi:hypothetical protein